MTFVHVQLALTALAAFGFGLSYARLSPVVERRTLRWVGGLTPVVFAMTSIRTVSEVWEPPVRAALPTTFTESVRVVPEVVGALSPVASWPDFGWMVWMPSLMVACWVSIQAVRLHGSVRATVAHGVHDGIPVRLAAEGGPYAAATLFGRSIVVDAITWAHPEDRSFALKHEATHHRNGDPVFAWIHWLIPILGPLNPLAWWLHRRLQLLDELVVDAEVGRLEPAAYAASLLRSVRRQRTPRLASAAGAHPLHQRIDTMLNPISPRSVSSFFTTALGLALLAGTAMAAGVSGGAVATEVVVAHASVDGRLQTFRGVERFRAAMKQTDAIDGVVAALDERTLPRDLAAVALVESGFKNLGVRAKPVNTAGMWQFIPTTARQYGLKVGGDIDERQDVARSTQAALNLLTDLHQEFDDWGLAFAGYYQGPKKVHAAIEAHGTRDVVTLVERGALEDYPLDVMAGAALMRERGLLD